MYEFIAQGIGVIAAAVAILSFQFKQNKVLFALQAFSGLMFFVNFLMLGSYTAACLNLINLFRGALLAAGDRFKSRWFAAALMAVYTVVTVVTSANWLSLLVLAAQLVGTVVMWSRKGKVIRLGQLFVVSPAWLIHNILNFSLGGLITEIVNILSILVSLVRYRKGFDEGETV